MPFYSLFFHSNLKANVCMCDFFHLHTIGDLNEFSVKEIWEGEQLFELRKANLKGKIGEICKFCNVRENQLDNIDDVADELLQQLESQRKEAAL